MVTGLCDTNPHRCEEFAASTLKFPRTPEYKPAKQLSNQSSK